MYRVLGLLLWAPGVSGLGFGVWGFGVGGLGFWVFRGLGIGFRVADLGLRVLGSFGFGVLLFWVWGVGFSSSGSSIFFADSIHGLDITPTHPLNPITL